MSAKAKWFYDKVDYGGDWDYKTSHGKDYVNFGNFNFGAAGAAAGFPLNTLQRMAGFAHQKEKQSPGDGGAPGTLDDIIKDFLLGKEGGEWPHGDEKIDQLWIEAGYNYFMAGCHNRK